ncbi:3-hydroxyacyl-CoA dehydrogenase family protein [Desulfobacula sp.]|uniref:3-hydroxyacyl-CoA dehydrogenase family protein n=1 Tax=Desulfobacula sp. TaxID=2593537 RepID=UPI0026365DD1|nr:3-hydroxyacyl-CoA dehydrogenase family protein [Desulfobacula sp.]
MTIKKVGIIGCGAMGSGIAQVVLQAGYKVIVQDSGQQFLDTGLKRIKTSLDKLEKKDAITSGKNQEIQNLLSGTIVLEDLSDCDLVIEAVFEEINIKQDVFSSLDSICKKETIFASNTSSLSITQMAAFTNRPSQFVGLHFFNPVPVMQLVEVVKTMSTQAEVLKTILDFAASLGKVSVVAVDTAGFLVNRLLTPFLLDAMQAAENGVASVRDIDAAMKLGCNHAMGPLMLADFIGLDVLYNASSIMFDEYKDSRYASPPILRKMVLSGNFGQKSGKGFYDWSDGRNPVPSTLNN